jgi:hypothetical protein
MKKQKLLSLIIDLFQDSQFFIVEARKQEGSDNHKRYIRASILTAWAGFEGWLNKTSLDFEQSFRGLTVHEKGLLKEKRIELKLGEFIITNSDKYESIDTKIEFLARKFAGKRLDRSTKNGKIFKTQK